MSVQKSILAPIPGVFYRRPSPDEEVYVEEGQEVKAGDIIGLIEVMKNFYEVKADEDCTIVSFKVENEEVINASQEIVTVKPS
ncbi:acetyl-CoA carboxylase [Halalkalibacterium ligniniphilum]|uniref:acetyl-CoA carboxylase n=1 Tax=Halalkalibacterium ligniniphilum TaxID=1134413 RepID=UPI00034DD29F|nr:acetyl-CoA carboxylase [Halalkalibacterium ligniniphilum]